MDDSGVLNRRYNERQEMVPPSAHAQSNPSLKPHGNRRHFDGLSRADRYLLRHRGSSTAVSYGNCVWCGKLFAYRASRPQVYCQPSHAHRAGKRRFHPIGMTRRQIYERDGWICHICGESVVDRPYRGGNLDPTCDHVIPVAHGGTDYPSNLRLAHNICNSLRGASRLNGGNGSLSETGQSAA